MGTLSVNQEIRNYSSGYTDYGWPGSMTGSVRFNMLPPFHRWKLQMPPSIC